MAANRFNPTSRNAISSAPAQESDDISLFLQQIILRSASSPSLSANARHHTSAALPDHLLGRNEGPETGLGQICLPDQHPPVLNSSSGFSFPAGNASSCSAGKLDSEADEYDYESEEVIEAEVEEIVPKPAPRSSSKRSRAAEVHNLSEKRRRSRINEKMKALQNLIPNSNKTDKASMLDEAIEYLKQLQLQVQMLTMRNGLSLYPICMPEILQLNQVSETRMDTYDSDKFSNLNMSKSISMDQRMQTDKCVKQAPLTDFSSFIDSKASFQVGSSHFGSFHNSKAYKEACEEKVQLGIPLDDDRHQMSSTRSIALETNTGNLNENSLEAGQDHILHNLVNLPIFSSQSNM